MKRRLPKQEREWLGQDKQCTTLATKLRQEPADVQLCIQEKNVIAYLVKNDTEDRIHISWLCVAPKHRRCGLGRLLINKLYVQAKIRQKGCLQLYVKPDNYRAQAFYKKIGFKKDGAFLKKNCNEL